MAVEARHLNLFPSQFVSNRDMMVYGTEGLNNVYAAGMMYGGLSTVEPVTGTAATAAEMVFPMSKDCTMRAESGLTYVNLPGGSRKRSREDSNNSINMNQFGSFQNGHQYLNISAGNSRSSAAQFTFLGHDVSSQIQRQQLEVDSFIAHHTEKVRLEVEERRKRYSRRMMAAVEEGMSKKLRAKDDEIQKMVKLNWALEERVKSLCVENQIWRDLAETNEASANVLRNNLEQVLAQLQNGEAAVEMFDDAESCCGSNENEEIERRLVEDNAVAESSFRHDTDRNCHSYGNRFRQEVGGNCDNYEGDRLCRRCGKDEACVLLLPCRHLCLCSACGSSQHICPVCKSTKNCSLHVNMSS